MDDMISRGEAIEALERAKQNIRHNIERAIGRAICEILDEVENGIKQLPSAEPQIIRCKDCEYAVLTYRGEVKYCDFWQTEDPIYMSADNFCSNAERRANE